MMRLTALRESRKWSRAELARRARMSNGDVGRIESKRLVAYPSQLAKMSDALGWVGDPSSLTEDVGDDVTRD